ncbi:hypothetical protein D3C81_11440 [compost metagenome]
MFGFWDIVLYILLIILALYVTRINNMWGVSQRTEKAKKDVNTLKKIERARRRTLYFLDKCEWVANNIGYKPKEGDIKDLEYKLARLRIVLKTVDRGYKPIELLGLLKGIQILSVMIAIIGSLLTSSTIFLVFLAGLMIPHGFSVYCDFKIGDEDLELEKEFPDLYLLLYTRLIKGSYNRLSPTLTDFIKSLDIMYRGTSHNVIRNFVVDWRNNIEIYGSDEMAIRKIKETYRSAMIINFCNLALQSINGVKNADKLLAFKIELSQKRLEQMKETAESRIKKGRFVVNMIYIILAEFVILSWLAKLTNANGLGQIFGN